MRYRAIGDHAVIEDGNQGYTFEVMDDPRQMDKLREPISSLEWDHSFLSMGGYHIFPYGQDNRLPTITRDIVKNNNEAPGMLKKKAQLLWGKGPHLYRPVIKDGQYTQEWILDREIKEWLDSWDYEDYFTKAIMDFIPMESFFSKYIPLRSTALGKPYISRLEHVPIHKARMASQDKGLNPKPTHVIVSDKAFGRFDTLDADYTVYPKYDTRKQLARQSIEYTSLPSFAQDVYNVPDIFGSLGWLMVSNNIPTLFQALSKNSISAKYHIQSPAKYWEKKNEMIQERCKAEGKKYHPDMLAEYKEQTIRSVVKVLSGVQNVGKAWHSEVIYDNEGHNLIEHGWKIEPIDQNIKDFVEGQIKISERASTAVATGLNIGSTLGNAQDGAKANSGSEQFYALANYKQTSVDMDELIVCKAVNRAIAINWPEKDVRIGFYQSTQKREEEVSPANRMNNLD